jgi:hypothetical protein
LASRIDPADVGDATRFVALAALPHVAYRVCVTLHRSRIAVLATLLAFLAVLGMTALGGWHAATFHDDVPDVTLAVSHVHVADVMDDHDDNVVHVAAHAVAHAFAVPTDVAPSFALAEVAPAWPTRESVDRAGTGPTSLLRPPRA